DALKTELLPMLDQGMSALMDDLSERNLLDETLVACMGEFGRTPKINKNAGRDHWGDCSSTLLFGGGIRGGQVYGRSDRHAAYPSQNPIDPIDIQATMYHCLGLPAEQMMYDFNGRIWPITNGKVIQAII
ncbi:MAG: DUF1501 domain-containing protein, partial [Planctomycetaceae bacterium]|nr:DUF1501 domain-containing protein [Planctomycetaceae bacterium]